MAEDKKKPDLKKVHSGNEFSQRSGFANDGKPGPLTVSRDRPAPTETPNHGKPKTED